MIINCIYTIKHILIGDIMDKSPYEIFQSECPELAAKFNELVQVQSSLKGLDQKTKQLINIAIQTC